MHYCTYSNPTAALYDTSIIFNNSIACCSAASSAPNAFDGALMSLWGADFNGPGITTSVVAAPLLGLDLRIELQPVPVPAAVWLFGNDLLGLAGIARRRQRG
jgi:hypothetical protein